MTSRYIAKVALVKDAYNVVLTIGLDDGVRAGMSLLIVGLGDIIRDPDTGEELEQLEVVRGRATVTHVQNKVCTATCSDVDKGPETRQIKKVSSRGSSAFAALVGPQDMVTESITPSEPRQREFDNVKVGDLVIKV